MNGSENVVGSKEGHAGRVTSPRTAGPERVRPEAADPVTRSEDVGAAPVISVLVPVYNVEDYLEECLDSLIAQTFSDIEMVCVNDGSTDSSREILGRRAARDPRIVVVDKPNGGLPSARNAGIRAARGNIVCFLDSDDRFEPWACERIVEVFESHGAEAVVYGARCEPPSDDEWLTRHLSPRDAVYEGFEPALAFEENSMPNPRVACLRRLLSGDPGSDPLVAGGISFDETKTLGEDVVFLFDLYCTSAKTVLISDKPYIYRVRREGSMTGGVADGSVSQIERHLEVAETVMGRWKARFGARWGAEIVSWSVEYVLHSIYCLPSDRRREHLARYAKVFRDVWEDVDPSKLGLPPADLAMLDHALDGKPVSELKAKLLRLRRKVATR